MSFFAAPDISRHLLRDEGEVVVDEVRKHWAAFLRPVLETVFGLAVVTLATVVDMNFAWVLLLLGFAILAHAMWLALFAYRDRFVVTNMRVFRIHGVFSTQLSTMPLTRILDITVVKPLHGRIVGFGHFVFESAAQEQGLREIHYVGRPNDRDLTIQRVVQRSGLRGPRPVN